MIYARNMRRRQKMIIPIVSGCKFKDDNVMQEAAGSKLWQGRGAPAIFKLSTLKNAKGNTGLCLVFGQTVAVKSLFFRFII